MKNLILGLAVCTFAFACKSNDQAEVTSPEGASAPNVECCDTKADCDAPCDGEMKSECSSEAKAECSSAKVCPMTGKTIEN